MNFFRLIIILLLGMFCSLVKAEMSDAGNQLRKNIDTAWMLCNQNPDSAMIVTDNALQKAIALNALDEKAELLRLKGLIYFYKVDYVKALNYFIKSRDLYRDIKNKSGEASALSNISLVYQKQGLKQKAFEMEVKALDMRKEIGDKSSIAASLNNLAVAYQNLGEIRKALDLYKEAVSVLININQEKDLELYYNNIGHMYMLLDKPDSAITYFNTSLEIGRRMNDKQMVCNSLVYIGEYFFAKQDYPKAIDYFKQGLKMAKEIGIVYEIEDASKKLQKAYAENKNYKDAYATLLLSKAMADSANNLKTMQKITEIETSLAYEKELELQKLEQDKLLLQDQITLHKHKQIRNIALVVVLGSLIWVFFLFRSYKREQKLNHELRAQKDKIAKQKEEIEEQRNRIEELNKTKDMFFALIAHDLKNPLIAISNMVEIMKLDFHSFEKEKLKEFVSTIHKSTRRAYELLENLLNWAVMQTGALKNTPVRFNLIDSIIKNIELLTDSSNQKGLKVKLTDNGGSCIAYADKEMIVTVIRNLLNNAIKFSNENGVIHFSLSRETDHWKVSISDNGIGISSHDLGKLFDLRHNNKDIGTSKEKGTGLGLVLCKDFVELNGGKIWVESEINKGSTFSFTVPAAT